MYDEIYAISGYEWSKKFVESGAYTCCTENHGMSTNDYALVRCDALEMVHQLKWVSDHQI